MKEADVCVWNCASPIHNNTCCQCRPQHTISDFYPDKHEALSNAGRLKPGTKMRTLHTVLKYDSQSGPSRQERSRPTRFTLHRSSMYVNFRPINQVVRHLLCTRTSSSADTRICRRNYFWRPNAKTPIEVVNADLGQRPCNCPAIMVVAA
jgi:hypothetical protein